MVSMTLDAFSATRARGTLEHTQLTTHDDVHRMAALGVAASVQPAHLLDDRDVTAQCWPDRVDRCFLFASMLRAEVTLLLGSDAPVAPLNPWLAMAAAVHRTGDDRPPWNAGESITPGQALAASVDGQGTIAAGSRGDVVLLDADPLAAREDPEEAATRLRDMPVAATFLAGRATYLDV
jgi:predicted amidohydrolase YtcJ